MNMQVSVFTRETPCIADAAATTAAVRDTVDVLPLINDGGTTAQLRAEAKKNGMRDLAEEAVDIAKQGTTTIEEAMKIAFSLEGEV